jgi:8-amino-7-oxononanoate synthase
MSIWDDNFAAARQKRLDLGQWRELRAGAPAAAGHLRRDGQNLVNFSANDYLGLAQHPALAARAAEYAAKYGTGSGASRLITGTMDAHLAVEARVAALKGTESALILASGWQANAAVLAALLRSPGPGITVFADALIHNSLHHGCKLAGTKPVFFRHNDMAHLAEKLAASPAGRKIILTETVFSMDGDRADLLGLQRLALSYDAFLYLDEAHATGVLGEGGRGLAYGLPGGADLVMGTFSKALGGFGAYIAGSREMIDFLINHCAGFIYTTALPPPVLGAIDAALDLLPDLDATRQKLASHAACLRDGLRNLGIDTGNSSSQIVPAIIGGEIKTLNFAEALRARGFLAAPIRPPTVPAGTSRLRLACSAAHHEADIAGLIAAIGQILGTLRAP